MAMWYRDDDDKDDELHSHLYKAIYKQLQRCDRTTSRCILDRCISRSIPPCINPYSCNGVCGLSCLSEEFRKACIAPMDLAKASLSRFGNSELVRDASHDVITVSRPVVHFPNLQQETSTILGATRTQNGTLFAFPVVRPELKHHPVRCCPCQLFDGLHLWRHEERDFGL